MKDTVLRGLVLTKYYERRRGQLFCPKPEDLGQDVTEQDILAISDQLAQHGMIEWKPLRGQLGKLIAGMGKISAFGIDVVEGEAIADIKVEFVTNQNISISGSQNVVIGNNNSQVFSKHIQEILSAIDNSPASSEEKGEAKGRLAQFLAHPLVASIAGVAAGPLIELAKSAA